MNDKELIDWLHEHSKNDYDPLTLAAERLEELIGAKSRPKGHWTKDRPTKNGYYWFRDEEGEFQILEWDEKLQWGYPCGGDVPWTYEGWGQELNGGMWWSEELSIINLEQ